MKKLFITLISIIVLMLSNESESQTITKVEKSGYPGLAVMVDVAGTTTYFFYRIFDGSSFTDWKQYAKVYQEDREDVSKAVSIILPNKSSYVELKATVTHPNYRKDFETSIIRINYDRLEPYGKSHARMVDGSIHYFNNK